MTMNSMSRSEFAALQLSLLQLEREEEKKRQKKLIEDSTLKLVVKTTSTDDKENVYFLTLEHESERLLPKHGIEQGSQVSVSLTSIVNSEFESHGVQCKLQYAVVSEVTPLSLTVSLQYETGIREGDTVCMKLSENTDHDRLSKAMSWLKNVETDGTNHSKKHAVPLVREMFKEHQQESETHGPDIPLAERASSLCFLNQQLNTSQRRAVELALGNRPLTVIHGPPGTGKTTTVVEVILQHVERGHRVLVCAPSNKAVDNLVEGVWKKTKKFGCGLSMTNVLRLGQLARIDEEHRQFSPELQAEKRLEEMGRSVRAIRRQNMEITDLTEQVMEDALVVMSTLTSVHLYIDRQERPFDLLVIDECAQATEAACWLAIPLARKVLLAGDHCQLPPTILSQEAAQRGLAVSLMERQTELHGEGVVHMLDTQYRMHELIQAWSSQLLYGSKLKAAPEVGSRLLTDLPGVRSTKQTQPTLLLVDTDGCKLRETQDAKTSSYRNNGEANLVVCHAKSLVKAGLPSEDIGVITPYKQQVGLIERKMRAASLDVEVNSVDGYQGREKEAILLSLVRSNERRQVGFVGDCRRLNVAVTRARRHLFIVCDTATVCRNSTIRSLVKRMERSGQARSAFCAQCPRGKDGYSADDDDGDDAGNDDDDAGDVSRLARNLRAVNLE